MKLFGQIIRDKRTAMALTQEELASKLGLRRPHLTKIEGHRPTRLSQETVYKIADEIGENPEQLYKKFHTEQFLLRGSDEGKYENVDLLTFSCFSSLVKRTKKNIKLRFFAGYNCLSILRNELLYALDGNNITIEVLLAEPTLQNIYERALRDDFDNQNSRPSHMRQVRDLDNLPRHIRHHQLRLEAALSMLAVIRSNKNRGILSIHLSQHYTPIHGMVFDDEVAIEQDASGDVVVIKRENDLEAFRQIDERFINEWDHKSSAFQWNTYFEETPHIFSKKEVETFLSKKKRPRKKQEI